MPLPRPSVVIFDMDGTTVRHLNPRILEVMERLDDLSFKIHKGVSRFFPFRRAKHKDALPRKKYSPKLLVHRTIHSIRRKPVEQIVEPCPHVIDVLECLASQNLPIGLVSNGLGRGYGHDILKQFDLNRFYDATMFAEDLNKSKPDPHPIIKMLSRLKTDIGDDDVIWYIGDRHKDINAALNAGKELPCKVVPIAYGYFGSACLAVLEHKLGTDHIIGSYSEFLQNLRTIFR